MRRWFARKLGLWRSRSQYIFDDQVLNLDMFIRIESFAESKALDARYRFGWWPEDDCDFFFEKKPDL
ncbi:MAG: hypothetical protein AB8B34_05340 [Prochlorococcus sp.]